MGATAKITSRNHVPSPQGIFTARHLLLEKGVREARRGKFHTAPTLDSEVIPLHYKC